MTDLPSSSELRSQFVMSAANKFRKRKSTTTGSESIDPTSVTEPKPHRKRKPTTIDPGSRNFGVSCQQIAPIANTTAGINEVTDITPKSVLQLPIVPIAQGNFLPDKAGLYFLCSGMTEGKVIYVGKALRLRERWGYKRHRSTLTSEAEKIRSKAVQAERKFLRVLELDLYIRWLVLDVDNEALSIWQDYAIKVLNPFFLTKETEGDTVLFCE